MKKHCAAVHLAGLVLSRNLIISTAILIGILMPAQATELTGEARIRDGDTIVVAGVPVRLNGLHCPETADVGGIAAARAIDELTRGKVVTCRLNGDRTYDRYVGRCTVDGYDIGATLIASGVCARCPRYDRGGSYVRVQRDAGRWTGGLPGYCR